ncbi:hypothetical protein PUN28_007273 [Cardiocondyla obscurior]|uniref:HIRA-interacting protein 3 n=2 Tax=Cardiocondyla obscurior TaxID=286306 RepID=A0AAW2G5C5_9HYME
MVKSEHSENEEDDMDRLHLSSDNSIDITLPKKRPRDINDGDEADSPAKKRLFNKQSGMTKSKKSKTALNKKIEKVSQDTSFSELETEVEEELNTSLKQENGNESHSDFEEKNVENNKDNKLQDSANTILTPTSEKEIKKKDEIISKEDVETVNKAGKKDSEEEGKSDSEEEGKNDSKEERTKKQHTIRKCTVDIEVVDGLELSVECASDNDESSSESKDEENVKPRPKTIIVKAEPNESELDCSSDNEKSDSEEVLVDRNIKSKKDKTKKKSSRTSLSKLKVSDSENSHNSNSDNDYSSRTKKKIKKSSATTKKSANKQSLVESKRGRGKGGKKNSHKKNDECLSDEDKKTVERESETIKSKNGTKDESSEKESTSSNESDDNSEREKKFVKSRKNQRGNSKSDSRIQMLKKYLKVAGVKVTRYNTLFADCKTNAKKIERLLELLEKNGVTGRPTMEKCKQARERNEKLKEISELDMANIISEGRITRARRNIENVKKGTHPKTPPRHREERIFRRIRTVVDSDSE